MVSIINEFVKENSPSEVNISGCQKSKILQYQSIQAFSLLDKMDGLQIFDEAIQKVEKILQQNLLGSFLNMYPHLSTMLAKRKSCF